jgi:hypothetical protein
VVNQQPLQWMGAAAQTGRHGAGQATCALCGTELPVSLMVPDGGEACTDVRWYCRDTVACTKRWTAAQARPAAGELEAAPGTLDAGQLDAGTLEAGQLDAGQMDAGQTGYDAPDGDQFERPVSGAPGAG